MADDTISKLGELLKKKPWYQLPRLLADGQLVEMRKELRAKNLHDTEDPPLSRQEIPANLDPALRHARTMDGTYNDLGAPQTPSAAHDTGALTVPSLESSHPADGHAIKLQQRRNGAA